MRLSTLLFAVLPALAAADDANSAAPSVTTITETSTGTIHFTKTITLARVHMVVSTLNSTSSAAIQPTGGITHPSSIAATTTTTTTAAGGATAVPTKGPSNAGAALDAGKVVFAGVAGMVIAALL
ncbi:hypothetical protein BBO_08813 [Beauveria brongniartii RCEF 3172]|uniref:Uncharacterized protein n=1 Tax=Beauveria brongniartii RCEF 3172 TaxID=1081107 RepID=A0A166WXX3_9HYPO|nr:hypothetical protein BBO_08813 [Beauveria brongniartii RCEF 3172]